MISLTLIIAVAFGAEPPALPEPTEAISGQCAESYALQEASAIPPEIIDGQIVACGGVLIPTSEVADLINYRTYATALNRQYLLDTEDLESEIRVLQAENNALKQPSPWLHSPQGQRWVGRAEVALVISSVLVSAFYIDRALDK